MLQYVHQLIQLCLFAVWCLAGNVELPAVAKNDMMKAQRMNQHRKDAA